MSRETKKAPVVHMCDLRFAWPGQERAGFELEDFSLGPKESLLLLGPSGSGKSTFLSLLTGIVAPERGEIGILGTRLEKMRPAARDRFRVEHFGIVFQMFNLLPYGRVMDNVVLPLSFAPKRRQRAEQAGGIEKEAHRLLTALGLDEALHNKPAAQLSIGQQQRVAVARALIGAPQIIVADEPTSALDRDRQEDFLQLLFAQVKEAGAALIMVSHDESHAGRFERTCHLHEIMKMGTVAKGEEVA